MTDLDLSLIGGSDWAAILGVSPFARPIDVWARIVHGMHAEQTEAMEWGHILEPIVATKFASHHPGYELLKPPSIPRPRGREWQRFSVDYVCVPRDPKERDKPVDPGRPFANMDILEIKTCSDWTGKKLGPAGSDDVPDSHFLQAQCYLEVSGSPQCHFAYLIGGQEYREYLVRSQPEFQAWCLEQIQRWWRDYVLTKKPPPVDPKPDQAYKAFPRALAGHRDEQAPWDREAVDAYLEAKRRVAEAKEGLRNAEGLLKLRIGDAKGIAADWGRVTWSEVRPQGKRPYRRLTVRMHDH